MTGVVIKKFCFFSSFDIVLLFEGFYIQPGFAVELGTNPSVPVNSFTLKRMRTF